MSLLEQIYEAGVVGAGGAGFPTHKKLASGVSMLVVDAAECEPLLASDRYVMRHHAGEITAALTAIGEALAIPRIVIGAKAKYTREIAALRSAIDAAGADIEIHGVESFYPAGDEQVLIYEICGQSVPAGGIPLDIGIVVINVTTALNIHRAIGGSPVTRHYVTVNGEVGRPTVVDAPIGASAADLIAAAGGATVSPYVIVRGGPMMGKHHPMERAGRLGYGKADGGLLVLSAAHPLIEFAAKPLARLINETKSACIQCQLCTDMCPRYLIGHTMRPHRVMRAIQADSGGTDLLDALACCECGICELFACPMGLSPRRINVYVKGLLRAEGAKIRDREVHREQTADREHRRIAQSRFVERWQLSDYPAHLDECVVCEPETVIIATRHGIGRPASPQVGVGDAVRAGQVIATVAFEDVGALVHASINGSVTAVDADSITIARTRSTVP